MGEQVPCFIGVDNTEMGGMEETEEEEGGVHRVAEVCRPPTQRHPHAPVSSQLFKSVTSTMLNRYTLCVCVLSLSVCICIGLKACVCVCDVFD